MIVSGVNEKRTRVEVEAWDYKILYEEMSKITCARWRIYYILWKQNLAIFENLIDLLKKHNKNNIKK